MQSSVECWTNTPAVWQTHNLLIKMHFTRQYSSWPEIYFNIPKQLLNNSSTRCHERWGTRYHSSEVTKWRSSQGHAFTLVAAQMMTSNRGKWYLHQRYRCRCREKTAELSVDEPWHRTRTNHVTAARHSTGWPQKFPEFPSFSRAINLLFQQVIATNCKCNN